MRLLGAILAGGKSSRFGSDKATAIVGGKPLMQHAIDALSPQVEVIISCGYIWPEIEMVEDWPEAGLGPLGGLNAGLAFAAAKDFDAVLSLSVDSYPVPHDLAEILSQHVPSFLANHYTIGCWPVSLAPMLDRHIAEGNRSVRSWIERSEARPIESNFGLLNINFVRDITNE